jgi:hypothetical protein
MSSPRALRSLAFRLAAVGLGQTVRRNHDGCCKRIAPLDRSQPKARRQYLGSWLHSHASSCERLPTAPRHRSFSRQRWPAMPGESQWQKRPSWRPMGTSGPTHGGGVMVPIQRVPRSGRSWQKAPRVSSDYLMGICNYSLQAVWC